MKQSSAGLKYPLCIVSGSYPPMRDGVGDYTRMLAHSMADLADTRPHVITSAEAACDEEQVRVHSLCTNWGIGQVLRAIRRLRKLRAGTVLVQAQSNGYGVDKGVLLLPWLLRFALPGVRMGVIVHEYISCSWRGRFRVLLAVPPANQVFVVSQEYLPPLQRHLPWMKKRMHYVPIASNMTPVEVKTGRVEELRNKLGIEAEDQCLVFFGVLRRRKGLEMLLKAFPDILHRHPQARLLLVGHTRKDWFDAEFAPLLKQSMIRDRITLTGRVDDETLSTVLSMSTLGVLPFVDGLSTRRGSFLALLAHGLVTVTTRPERAIPEFEDGVHLRYVNRGDTQGLADTVCELLEDPEKRQAIAANLPQAARHFDWETISGRMLSLLSKR